MWCNFQFFGGLIGVRFNCGSTIPHQWFEAVDPIDIAPGFLKCSAKAWPQILTLLTAKDARNQSFSHAFFIFTFLCTTVFFLGGLLLYVYRWLFVHFKLISYKTFVAGRMWEAVYPVYSLLWLKLVLMELFADRIWCDLTWSCPLTGWWIVCIFVSWRRNTDPPLRGQSCLSCNSKEGDLHPSLGVASTRRADLDDNADGAKPFFQPDLRLETWFESRRRRQEPLYVLVCPDGQRRRLFGRKIACVFWEACGGMQSQKIVSSNLSLIWENARQ